MAIVELNSSNFKDTITGNDIVFVDFRIFLGSCFVDRLERLARTTPRSPEIDEDNVVAGYGVFEIG